MTGYNTATSSFFLVLRRRHGVSWKYEDITKGFHPQFVGGITDQGK